MVLIVMMLDPIYLFFSLILAFSCKKTFGLLTLIIVPLLTLILLLTLNGYMMREPSSLKVACVVLSSFISTSIVLIWCRKKSKSKKTIDINLDIAIEESKKKLLPQISKIKHMDSYNDFIDSNFTKGYIYKTIQIEIKKIIAPSISVPEQEVIRCLIAICLDTIEIKPENITQYTDSVQQLNIEKDVNFMLGQSSALVDNELKEAACIRLYEEFKIKNSERYNMNT